MKIRSSLALILSAFPLLSLATKPALAIKIIKKAPQVIVNQQSVQAKYQVVNTSSQTIARNSLVGLAPGIRQITTEQGACQNPFDLAVGASCTLILEIDATTLEGRIQGGPKICPALEQTPCYEPQPQDRISVRKNEDLDAILNKPEYKNALWGLQVVDQKTGDLLIDLSPENHFFIGSIRKLFSVGELLNEVGANYEFHTPVNYQGTIDSKGILSGDLILVASGDLTMGGRNLPNGKLAITDFDHNEANALGNAILTKTDPLAGYKILAKQVYDFGIRRIKGDVIIDDRLFTPFNFRDEFDVSAIFVNDDVVDVLINPSTIDQPAAISWQPVSSAFEVSSTMKTLAKNTKASYKLEPELSTCIGSKSCKGLVEGNIPANYLPPLTGKFPLVQTFRITKPANYARTVFIEALHQAGVTIDAPALANNPQPPSGATIPVTELISLPYSEFAKWILKVSYNIGADTSLVLWGLANNAKTMADTLKIERSKLTTEHQLPEKEFTFIDGSGGGDTRATNSVVTKWLGIMKQSPVFQTFVDALPILGVDGSLATITAFQTNPSLRDATGKVRAKTGTYVTGTAKGLILRGQDFAGYIDSRNGRQLIYQLVVNNVPVNSINDILKVFQDEGTLSAILWRDF